MKSHIALAVSLSLTGCATGYGTLAGVGVGAVVGVAAAGSNELQGQEFAQTVVGGMALGALFGVISSAVAAGVSKSQERERWLRYVESSCPRPQPTRPEPPARRFSVDDEDDSGYEMPR